MVKRKGFTLLELVMVIVVFGIVASIGADIISSMYKNYLRTRTINRLQTQTEITLEQIAKRLQYRIKESVVVRKPGVSVLSLANDNVDNNFTIMEWIAYSNESFLGATPNWTGLVDIENPNTNKGAATLVSPGSDFTITGLLMDALTNQKVDLTAGKEAALVFKKSSNTADFGWGVNANTDGTNALKVRQGANQDSLIITSALPDQIYEHYYLAHTAYALIPEGSPNDFNLTLRYNYQPWLNEFYSNGSTALMAQNVRLFRFRQDANLVRIKLCLHDANQTGVGDFIVTCKEKVVF
ncbi:type II secretion system protein [Sulfurospirillum sp. T05]|uniref:Type II secretion system protein n=1 Tax=Sulfurospirillum tamanense TaxID=2813362 RepID=A0ABS2WQF2_9BACT|nr:type II secretion system protein [Sulfurospirillum tamanensis]MBN2963812.1 type II secretion system protein [Sulfurospirillum tamanensis]